MANSRRVRTRRTALAVRTGCALLVLVKAAAPQAMPCAFELHPAYESHSFLGYACVAGCREHKSGFAWAERRGIANAEACVGPGGTAFVEGCRAYADAAGTAEQAGHDWARDNEVTEDCACAGAGPGFEAGCAAYLSEPGE